jgi:hypothetical protein
VRENRMQGSVRGLPGNWQFYLDMIRILHYSIFLILVFDILLKLILHETILGIWGTEAVNSVIIKDKKSVKKTGRT